MQQNKENSIAIQMLESQPVCALKTTKTTKTTTASSMLEICGGACCAIVAIYQRSIDN